MLYLDDSSFLNAFGGTIDISMASNAEIPIIRNLIDLYRHIIDESSTNLEYEAVF